MDSAYSNVTLWYMFYAQGDADTRGLITGAEAGIKNKKGT